MGLSKGLPWYENQTNLYYLGMPERNRWAPDPGSPLFVEKWGGGQLLGYLENITAPSLFWKFEFLVNPI